MQSLYTLEQITRYAGGQMDNNNKNLRLLAGADSIHDFNDKGVRVPIRTWEAVFQSLLQNLNTLSNTNHTNLTAWTQGMSTNKIPAGSIEEKTVSYFESEYPGKLSGKTVILTYRQVIDTIGNNPNNDAILQANRVLCGDADILEIDMAPNENWNTSYSTPNKITIGLFLLNFYFPQIDAAYNTSNPSYITFDAGSNIPSKIFGLLDQVINLVTPLNIADSATEGTHLATDKNQKRAGVKNKYVFPVNTLRGQPERYIYNSNIFTMSNSVKLYIKKPPGEYDEKNKYNFSVFVQKNNEAECELIKFTNGGKIYKSGPGVEYLSEVMHGTQDAKPSTGVIAPINTNCPNLTLQNKRNALYLDVKRSGDWEQCLAALTVNKLMDGIPQKGRVILSTIDRLCALFSRCIGQNTLYHYGTQLILYRYKTGVMTADELATIEAANAAEARTAQTNAEQAIVQIDEVFNVFATFESSINTVFNVSINGFNANSQLKQFINKIAKLLVYASLQKYKEIKQQFRSTQNQNPKQFLSSLKELTGEYVTYNKMNDFITTISNFTRLIQQPGVNTMILPKGRFCYYDSALLIDIHNSLLEINTFDPRGRVTKTLSNFNYKTRLEDTGLFSNLNKISTELDIISKPILDSALLSQQSQQNQQIINNQSNQLEESALDVVQNSQQTNMINVVTRTLESLVTSLTMNETDKTIILNSITNGKDIIDDTQSQIQSQIQSGIIINNMSAALSNDSTPIVKLTIYVQAFVTLFSLVQYINTQTDPLYIDYTNTNKAYYTSLKILLDTVINSVVPPQTVPNRGGGLAVNEIIQTGGQLGENEINNLYENLRSTMTSEFVSLTASLNDIAKGLLPENIQQDIPIENEERLPQAILRVLKTNQINPLDISINNNIIALLQVYFENSWNAITEAEALIGSKLAYEGIIESYYILYIFFGCFYGNFNQQFYTGFIQHLTTPQRKQEINQQRNHGDNMKNIKYFLKQCNFFNDYINENVIDIHTTNIQIKAQYIISIIQRCLPKNIDQLNNKNAYVLVIFMNIYGVLNQNILEEIKQKRRNVNISPSVLADLGYNKSIFDGFGDFSKFIFKKAKTLANNTNNINNQIQNTEIKLFKIMNIIVNTFSMYYLDGRDSAITYINTQAGLLRGGKRTRKNRRKQKKLRNQMKTMRHKK